MSTIIALKLNDTTVLATDSLLYDLQHRVLSNHQQKIHEVSPGVFYAWTGSRYLATNQANIATTLSRMGPPRNLCAFAEELNAASLPCIAQEANYSLTERGQPTVSGELPFFTYILAGVSEGVPGFLVCEFSLKNGEATREMVGYFEPAVGSYITGDKSLIPIINNPKSWEGGLTRAAERFVDHLRMVQPTYVGGPTQMVRIDKSGARWVHEPVELHHEGTVDGGSGGVQVSTGGIATAMLADLAISSTKIADGAVLTAKIPDLSIITSKLAAFAVDNTKLANLAVDAAKLADSSVTSTKIANLAVGTAAIALLAVGNAQIGNAAVTNAKIGNLAVSTAQIQDGAVITAKIGTAQITTALVADAAITNAKIGALAVGTAQIQDAAITAAKIGTLTVANITGWSGAAVNIGGGGLIFNGAGGITLPDGSNIVVNPGYVRADHFTCDSFSSTRGYWFGTEQGLYTTRVVKDGSGNNKTVYIKGGIIVGWDL